MSCEIAVDIIFCHPTIKKRWYLRFQFHCHVIPENRLNQCTSLNKAVQEKVFKNNVDRHPQEYLAL